MFCNKAGDYLNPNLTVEQRNKLFIDTAETIMAQEGSSTTYFADRLIRLKIIRRVLLKVNRVFSNNLILIA